MDPSWVMLQICELEMVQVILWIAENSGLWIEIICSEPSAELRRALCEMRLWRFAHEHTNRKKMLWKRCSNLNNDLWSEVEVLTLHLQVLSIIPAAQIRSLARTGFYLFWQHQNRKSYWWFEGCPHAKCWPMSCLIKNQVIICVWYRKCLELPPKSARM